MDSGPLGDDGRRKNQSWQENENLLSKNYQNNVKNSSHVPRESSRTFVATSPSNGGSNSLPRPRKRSRVDDPMISGNFSTDNRIRMPVSDDGVPGYTRIEDRVKISLGLKSKMAINELKRKLKSELDQVRSVAKKLEAKESKLRGCLAAEYSQSQFSSNIVAEKVGRAMNSYSEVGSVEVQESIPGLVAAEKNTAVEKKNVPKTSKSKSNSEFVHGKAKSTPQDGEYNGFGVGNDQTPSPLFKSCSNLLAKLMKHKHGWVFNVPVDAKRLGLHDYFKIVKKPMDLGTVRTRLNKNWYKSPGEFAEDVRLTFRNAMLYNPKGQDVHIMAEQLSTIFEEKWASMEAEYKLTKRSQMDCRAILPKPTSRHNPAPLAHPSHTAMEEPTIGRSQSTAKNLNRPESMKEPTDSQLKPPSFGNPCQTKASKKPNAKVSEKRDMTYEEKQKLSTSLQNLPSEKLDQVVQIIKKRNQGLFQNDDEIEVDIASVDSETLWELNRFVTNYYKKTLHENRIKDDVPLQSSKEPKNMAVGEDFGEDSSGDNTYGSGSGSGSGSDEIHSPIT